MCVLFTISLLCSFVPAQSILSAKIFNDYRQFVWQDQQGLPQNGISAIVQTPDGYLWLAIAEGVVRFDGVGFTAFDTSNTAGIKSNNVQSLLVARDGTLWIGTHGGGLTGLRSGEFTNYSTADGLSDTHIKSLFEDSRGNLWIGTDGGGVNVFSKNHFTALSDRDGLPDNFIRAFAEDADGNVWIGTSSGLVRIGREFSPGTSPLPIAPELLSVYLTGDGLASDYAGSLFFDREKRLWIGGEGLTVRTPDGTFSAVGKSVGIDENADIRSIVQDRDGDLFFGSVGAGLFRLSNGKLDRTARRDGLVTDEIQALYADEAGNIWLGSNGSGLVKVHRGQLDVMTSADGLPGEMINAVFRDATDAVWAGTDEGLVRIANGIAVEIRTPDGSAIRGVNMIHQTPEGLIWISSNDRETGPQVFRFDAATGRIKYETSRNELRAAGVLMDDQGNYWLDDNAGGIRRVSPDGATRRFRKADGLADDYITTMFKGRDGAVWVGTRNGLSRFSGDELTTFNENSGFGGKHVLAFHEDSRGNLWISTDGNGLFRFRNGKFGVVTVRDGLYDNLAFSILEDSRGNLWMSGNKGIYRANIPEIEEFLGGSRSSIESFAYGVADGMISRECNGANPGGTRTDDGRLWFPTIRGIAIVDPANIDANPPRVWIENALVDGTATASRKPVEIRPSQENLEIRFAAISWNRPQQVRFRYQLVGLDKEWVEAGTRRVAYYPHLPPGEFTFRVIADNGEGVWDTEGATLTLRVFPPFYRTWWFFVVCVLFALFIIRLLYAYRLAQLEKINEVKTVFTRQLIDYQEQERQRIAVELHDSIGQSLIVIRNRALMGLSEPRDASRLVSQLEEISESAADSIREIRQIAHNLHPYQLEHLGLKTALESMIEQAEESSEIDFKAKIDDVDDLLSKESEINFYRIVQESVNNILKHSKASAAEISILRNNGNLSLLIRDNGKGFESGNDASHSGGLGLAGLSERAKMLNAQLEIRSGEGKGTTVRMSLELSK